MPLKRQLPDEVAQHLGPFYIYLLIDPRDRKPFYVGKGTGHRLTAHGKAVDVEPDPGEPKKSARIREIRAAGLEPRIDVVRHGIKLEEHALEIEAAVIDTLPDLMNCVRGQNVLRGRMPLDELVSLHGAPGLDTKEKLLFIRLGPWEVAADAELSRTGHGFRLGMTNEEIYASTRGWWKIAQERASDIRHAVAVYQGVTRAVFSIEDWLPQRRDGRRAFEGTFISEGPIWDATVGPIGRRVPFAAYAQNPLKYWP